MRGLHTSGVLADVLGARALDVCAFLVKHALATLTCGNLTGGSLLKRGTVLLIAVCAVVFGLGSASAGRPFMTPTATTGPIFAGNGGKALPPFKVTVASTLRWTNNGSIFQIFPKSALGGGSVNSTARTGATYLKPGSYRLDVNAIGSWKIQIVAGVERPQALGSGLIGFRGNGGRDLPPFSNRRGTNLLWTNSGSIFQIFSSDFSVSVNSQAKQGKTYMDAGRHQLTVNAIGTWTIRWKP